MALVTYYWRSASDAVLILPHRRRTQRGPGKSVLPAQARWEVRFAHHQYETADPDEQAAIEATGAYRKGRIRRLGAAVRTRERAPLPASLDTLTEALSRVPALPDADEDFDPFG